MNKKKENYIKIKTKTNTFIINPKQARYSTSRDRLPAAYHQTAWPSI